MLYNTYLQIIGGGSGELSTPVLSGWGEGVDGANLGDVGYIFAVNLEWDSIAGATIYEIYRAVNPPPFGSGDYSLFTTISESSYRDTDLSWPSGPYLAYKIVAKNSQVSSEESNVFEIGPFPMIPP